MNQTMTKRILLYLVGLLGMGFALALSIRIDLGLAALDAFNRDLTYLFSITQGVAMWITPFVLIAIQVLLLGKKFKLTRLQSILGMGLVGVAVDLVGLLINQWALPTTYMMRMVLFLIAQVISAISIALVLYANLLTFPFEQTAQVIADKIKQPFARVRFSMEFCVAIIVLIMTVVFQLPNQIKEGTIIILIMSSPIISYTTSLLKKYLPLKEEKK